MQIKHPTCCTMILPSLVFPVVVFSFIIVFYIFVVVVMFAVFSFLGEKCVLTEAFLFYFYFGSHPAVSGATPYSTLGITSGGV